ncbi:MAG TPA: hypothetical protein VMY37_27855 [Thermoguttaceae bacterium]|nr:hypothetical protein [Thermoguttaceae bacterium]
MAEEELRVERVTWPIAGFGGHLALKWQSCLTLGGEGVDDYGLPTGERPTGPEDILDIKRWEIEHIDHNAEIPMSGGRGSISRRRVCDDFRFQCLVDVDTKPTHEAEKPANNATDQPFLDGRLEGKPKGYFQIAVRFHCGDPSYWSRPDWQHISTLATDSAGLFYFCPAVMLENVRTINSNEGDDVVTCVVRGSGSAPLERWVNDTFVGAGAFGMGVL